MSLSFRRAKVVQVLKVGVKKLPLVANLESPVFEVILPSKGSIGQRQEQ